MAQPYRTAYHFQPPRNWMNDPNGPMIYKGIYHLFYQYNPESAEMGNIAWGHSTSTDLLNWTIHPLALLPSDSYDINGCWSGSATMLQDGTTAMLYTGRDSQKVQLQNLAVPKDPSDPYLVEWIDHSIVESFGGGGKVCMTTRVYPTLAINDDAHIFVFNNGSQHVDISTLTAWSLKQANIN
ncbi:Beta-fructofuranosidase, insoluble isoenzyme cwinv1 [Datura stramonium]|uniref:Beta-fructofuranosidase, insoluble isoenzyme cwinv1 n=1 Tax=Datura stramonium TaxID=4076 RepID=A0ABS8VKR8_DATST|nr:Beta-fructofuranosidase, insoluble isoenzyme cwinv1 [Datura stramonium]